MVPLRTTRRNAEWISSVFKLFDIRKSMRPQFRTEIYNLTNTANLAEPGTTLGAAKLRNRLCHHAGVHTPRDSVQHEAPILIWGDVGETPEPDGHDLCNAES